MPGIGSMINNYQTNHQLTNGISSFTLPKFNSSHLPGGRNPKGNSSEPTPVFQVRAVSFRGCNTSISNSDTNCPYSTPHVSHVFFPVTNATKETSRWLVAYFGRDLVLMLCGHEAELFLVDDTSTFLLAPHLLDFLSGFGGWKCVTKE